MLRVRFNKGEEIKIENRVMAGEVIALEDPTKQGIGCRCPGRRDNRGRQLRVKAVYA